MRRTLLALLGVAACYNPQPWAACALSCDYQAALAGAAQGCPDSLVCAPDKLCHSAGDPSCPSVVTVDAPRAAIDVPISDPDTASPIDAPPGSCRIVTTAFEDFPDSSIVHDGWTMTGPYDSAVIANPLTDRPELGAKTWRLSNRTPDSGSGGDPTSPRVTSVGEATASGSGAATRVQHFYARFDFASATGSAQPGLEINVPISSATGQPLAELQLTSDESGNLGVGYFSTSSSIDPNGSNAGCKNLSTSQSVASMLPFDHTHTVEISLDIGEGTNDDVVRVSVDGVVSQPLPSWETYYRCSSGGQSVAVDSLVFQPIASGRIVEPPPEGFLFDNVTVEACDAPLVVGSPQ